MLYVYYGLMACTRLRTYTRLRAYSRFFFTRLIFSVLLLFFLFLFLFFLFKKSLLKSDTKLRKILGNGTCFMLKYTNR